MHRRIVGRAGLALATATGIVLALLASTPAEASTASRTASEVNVSASHGHDTPGCGHHARPCLTIQYAVHKAAPGSTIKVQPGTYHGQVVVTKTLTLQGHHAVLDATGQINGFAIGGTLPMAPPTGPLPAPMAAGSRVSGFTVQHALGEGILVFHTHGVVLTHNHVVHNDLGAGTPVSPECASDGNEPGDCGEGLHLLSSWRVTAADNEVSHNVGGILVTDEVGPAHDNRIVGNRVQDNVEDCGITLPSHNGAAYTDGQLRPADAGVYDNWVVGNLVTGNGGAGVLMVVPFPGTASYDNHIVGNAISGNGNSGVTLHAHAPAQYLSGNVVKDNFIGTNNLAGDEDAGVTATTGVLVSSPVVPVRTVISGNVIARNHFGVWLGKTASAHANRIRHSNSFYHVDVRVFVAS
jgi:nitrous oxidase accessory protein NosD